MRLAYFGTYDIEYPRNRVLIDGLRRLGVQVRELNRTILPYRDRSRLFLNARGITSSIAQILLAEAHLATRWRQLRGCDAIIVGYLGQQDIPLAWLISRFLKIPLLFNPMVSLTDTIVEDRSLVANDRLLAGLLASCDRWAFQLPRLVLSDTKANADYFARSFGIPHDKIAVCPIGAERIFFEGIPQVPPDRSRFRIVFVGKLTPLHGIEYIIEAARLLGHDSRMEWLIVGSGQLEETLKRDLTKLNIPNLRWIPWVEYWNLPSLYASADLALGIFGLTAKARRVIPNKVFQAIATGCCVLTADTAAVREFFQPGSNILTCLAGQPIALAEAIRFAAEHSTQRKRIGLAGRDLAERQFCPEAVASTALNHLGNSP